jgi:CarD family transcriptional regulator
MEFKIGDTVVEPSIGICRIEGIRQMSVDGDTRTFYVFHAANNASVMVPTNQIEKRGVRRPMSKEEARKVMTALKTPASPNRNDAKMQYTAYREILNSGDPTRIARLLRDLFTLDQTNELKGKEREIMEQARTFLINEISHIRDESKTKISDDISDSLRQMYKKKVQKDRELRKKNALPPL